MLAKFLIMIGGAIVTLITDFVIALIGTLFIYAGWNWGIVPALPTVTHLVDLPGAFWLSLGLSLIGSQFQSKLNAGS